jgi:hypothetical protein
MAPALLDHLPKVPLWVVGDRGYSSSTFRDRERQAMETAEQEYRTFIAAWRRLPPEGRTSAATLSL